MSKLGSGLIAVLLFVGCGGGEGAGTPDASVRADAAGVAADARPDAFLPGPPDGGPRYTRVSGHVEKGGEADGEATATLFYPSNEVMAANSSGDFSFDLVIGTGFRVRITSPGVRPMVRTYVARDNGRQRQFYMLGRDEEAALAGLGLTIDEGLGMLEVDFRNAGVGGYGVVLTGKNGPIQPGWGVALDKDGRPVSSMMTVAGGDGSTLWLGNIPVEEVLDLTPVVPGAAPLPCKPCDLKNFWIESGVVVWTDFECGSAEDCE